MNFVQYFTNVFPNLDGNKTTILESDSALLSVNSITICNKSDNTIRVNLLKNIVVGTKNSEAFLVNNLEVEARNKSTVNLVSLFGLEIFLPAIQDGEQINTSRLVCFSNGTTQKFDVVVDYTKFIETNIL